MTRDTNGTSGGVDLDDKLLRGLTDEAEHGYDPKQLRPRLRRGRPPMGRTAATVFQVRLEPELRDALERVADDAATTPSQVVRAALRQYLASMPSRWDRVDAAPGSGSKPRAPAADARRDVTPNPSGGWDVRKPTSKRVSSHHATQTEAIQVARRILRNQGGGELLVKGRDGRVRDRTTISRDTDPHQETG